MTKTQMREIAKDAIQKALSKAYYIIADNPEEHGLTEEDAVEVIRIMDSISEQLCKRMGREHYTV